jgi:hypothetical protein
MSCNQNVREKCFEILLNEKGEKSLQDNSQVDEDFIKKGENSSKKYESANSERILVNEENTTNDCKTETLLHHHDKNSPLHFVHEDLAFRQELQVFALYLSVYFQDNE